MVNTRSSSGQRVSAGAAGGGTRTTAAEPKEAPAPTADDSSRPAAAGNSPAGLGTTLRLPFMTATFTRTPARPATPAEPARPVAAVGPDERQRFAFYAGAAALGALEVVEWPVALLVAAGTYLAGRTKPSMPERPSVAGSTGDDTRPGL